MWHRLITLSSVLVAIASLSLWAVEMHSGHSSDMSHSAHNEGVTDTLPQEGGQAIFSALAEIVTMLEEDVKTDWGKVNIDDLRIHLLDMNHLMLNTEAETSITEGRQIRFLIEGDAASIPSIHRMIPAHSWFIENSRDWKIENELTDKGATLTILTNDKAQISRIKALGFYGFMSLDSHHQAHHYQMALGNSH